MKRFVNSLKAFQVKSIRNVSHSNVKEPYLKEIQQLKAHMEPVDNSLSFSQAGDTILLVKYFPWPWMSFNGFGRSFTLKLLFFPFFY